MTTRLKKLKASLAVLDEDVERIRSAIERANRDLAADVEREQAAADEFEAATRDTVHARAAAYTGSGEAVDTKARDALRARYEAARAAVDERRQVLALLSEKLEEAERVRRAGQVEATRKAESAILKDLASVWDKQVRPLLVEHAALQRIGPPTREATRVATGFFVEIASRLESHAFERKLPGGGVSERMFEPAVDKLIRDL